MSMRIAVIEDEKISRKLIDAVLSVNGHEILLVEDAAEAIPLIRAFVPHAILMDLSLPEIDGLMLTRWLKMEPDLASIPVVAVTAYPGCFNSADAFHSGCAGYILKPIDTRQIESQLIKIIEASAA